MPKSTAPSPKRVVLQRTFSKIAPSFRRMMAGLARSAVSPAAAERDLAKARDTALQGLKAALAATELPVVGVEDTTPAGAHWLVVPLGSPRNAMYSRLPVMCAVAYVEKDGTCPIGAIMDPYHDVCAIAEAGLGLMAPDRVRCASRSEAEGCLVMLPWKTKDTVAMGMMEALDKAGIHTRKSGCTLSDIVDVAAGRADAAVTTRLNRAEALLANLMMAESGGFAGDMKGKPLGPSSEAMVIANPRLHSKIVALLNG